MGDLLDELYRGAPVDEHGQRVRLDYEIVRAASRYLATDPTAPLDEIAALANDDPVATSAANLMAELDGKPHLVRTLEDRLADQFPRRGPQPTIAPVTPAEIPARLIAFIRERTAAGRVGLGGAAILVPDRDYGVTLAQTLTRAGLRAEYAKGDQLDLGSPAVKITTLQSAKGLEFPIVAIAGLHLPFGHEVRGLTGDEAAEEWQRRRRTLYVGMTRAMRSLLVLVPDEPSPLTVGLLQSCDASPRATGRSERRGLSPA